MFQRNILSATSGLKMVCFSETFVSTYKSTRCYHPEQHQQQIVNFILLDCVAMCSCRRLPAFRMDTGNYNPESHSPHFHQHDNLSSYVIKSTILFPKFLVRIMKRTWRCNHEMGWNLIHLVSPLFTFQLSYNFPPSISVFHMLMMHQQ
jgi:hypothetical protein